MQNGREKNSKWNMHWKWLSFFFISTPTHIFKPKSDRSTWGPIVFLINKRDGCWTYPVESVY